MTRYPGWRAKAESIVEERNPSKDEPFECIGCGLCCIEFSQDIKATKEDMERWVREDRFDIFLHPLVWVASRFKVPMPADICPVGELFSGRKEFLEVKRGLEEETGLRFYWNGTIDLCSFLKRGKHGFMCAIHETKPTMCKEFECKLTALPKVTPIGGRQKPVCKTMTSPW